MILVLQKNYHLRGDYMKAIIMAGGEGSRLRPLTCDLPKPMVPIVNKPVIEHTIGLLKSYGITEIGITLMFHPQIIKDYLGNGKSFGVNITYFIEESPLGTAGGLKAAKDFLNETFIVISGDSLTNLNIKKALDFHIKKGSLATLVLTKVSLPLEYGVVLTNPQGNITGFLEKPSWGEVFSDTINTGTYILEPAILNYISVGRSTDFSMDIFPSLLKDNMPLYGYIMNDYWCDIGDIRSYIKSQNDVLDGFVDISIDGEQVSDNIWVGPGAIIDSTAQIIGPCVIGANCKIGKGTVIDKYSIIGDNVTIENNVSVVRSIIWNNSYIEYGSELRGAILCNRVNLKHYVSVFENAVVGEGCKISERCIIKPNVKIWPEKIIEPLAIVDRNMIWGTRHTNKIFGENGISGIINVDISPEFATRLGAAYGTQFKLDSRVVVSSTNSNSARMFKHAFISGILSVGIEVYNMSSLLTPISRNAINFLTVEGGIHIKNDIDNPNILRVNFMNKHGCAISRVEERKIENSFFKEDFKRCSAQQISRLNNITDFSNYYMRSVTNSVDISSIRKVHPRICVFSPSEFVISIIEPMLKDIGCDVKCYSSTSCTERAYIMEQIKIHDADFGAIIDKNAESLVLVNTDGTEIRDDLFQAFISLIVFRSFNNSVFYVPLTGSEVIEKLAIKYNCRIKRTKNSPNAVIQEILLNTLFSTKESQLLISLGFDALAGLIKIVEFICCNNTSVTELLSEIPDFYMSKKCIFCPWELKGMVMRTIISEHNEKRIELLDGIKLYSETGWVLILPDADIPAFRIIAESASSEEAEAIASKYYSLVESIILSS